MGSAWPGDDGGDRKVNPEAFFATCARLLPRDVAISIQTQAPILDAADLQILKAIKQALPNAGDREPSEVLQFVLDAVRAHEAKVIDATCCDTNS